MTLSGRNLGLPSRFFLAPINTGFCLDGVPTVKLVRFHAKRAGNCIGVAYVGNVAVAAECRSNPGTPVLMRSGDGRLMWERLAATILENGSIPAIQLACCAGASPSPKVWVCANLEGFVNASRAFVSGLSVSDIHCVCRSFIDGAAIASAAGFRVVQIHAAHGYLLSLFLNRMVNLRRDSYGVEHCGIVREIADGIASAVPNLVLDVRVSLFDGLEERGAELAYRRAQIVRISKMGFDIISLSAGMYGVDKRMIYPGLREGEDVYLPLAREFASEISGTTWNVAGNLRSPAALLSEMENLTFSIGRPLIADPYYVVKALSGRDEEIIRCRRTGRCHYYSRGTSCIECGVNADL